MPVALTCSATFESCSCEPDVWLSAFALRTATKSVLIPSATDAGMTKRSPLRSKSMTLG